MGVAAVGVSRHEGHATPEHFAILDCEIAPQPWGRGLAHKSVGLLVGFCESDP